MVKHLGKAGSSTPRSILMTESEFEDFWHLLDARRRVDAYVPERHPHAGAPSHNPAAAACESPPFRGAPSQPAASTRPASKPHHRCGTCRGCTSTDCGLCKNCRDKPRFGGPGIKKKACLRRQCLKMRRDDDDDDDDDDDQAPSFGSSSMMTPRDLPSEKPSPLTRPCSPPPDDERQPLEDLDAHPNRQQMDQLDLLSHMAAHGLSGGQQPVA